MDPMMVFGSYDGLPLPCGSYMMVLRALRILNLTGVILRHLLPVMHKSGTKNNYTITAIKQYIFYKYKSCTVLLL